VRKNALQIVSDVEAYDTVTSASSATSLVDELEEIKRDLVNLSGNNNSDDKPSPQVIGNKVRRLEEVAEQVGIGQASSTSGLLNGEWELIYSPEDITRSSPFFWAFRRAFPDSSDQIFSITDNIPAPIKEVGPAYQTIKTVMDNSSAESSSSLVSRIKVATLGGIATSIMTTRCTILNTEGLEGLRLRVESTKPEKSSVLETLGGPLGKMLSEKSMPFPSGEALEAAQPGSSEILMVTTFCDEGLRISRNADEFNGIYLWKRKSFGDGLGGGGVDI